MNEEFRSLDRKLMRSFITVIAVMAILTITQELYLASKIDRLEKRLFTGECK